MLVALRDIVFSTRAITALHLLGRVNCEGYAFGSSEGVNVKAASSIVAGTVHFTVET